MVNSFDGDPEIARCSPGDLLLQSIIESACREGLTGFDLGIGEARYKDSWCNESVAMFDSIMPVSVKGRVYARYESLRLNAKRWIKQSDWAWPLLLRVLRRG
jgi:CelD/BcsL family acetyltransferase involved in cellulose biosynthesis